MRTSPTYTFDKIFNGSFMLRQIVDLNFKYGKLIKIMPSLLAFRETSPFEF